MSATEAAVEVAAETSADVDLQPLLTSPRRQILTPTVDPLLCGNKEFLHVARMTQPNETESVQTYGLAEGDRVEFEIEEPQRGRKGRQTINVKIGTSVNPDKKSPQVPHNISKPVSPKVLPPDAWDPWEP